jgi:hypothetical protein
MGQISIYRKFTEISGRIANNLISTKLEARPDYLDTLLGLIKKTNDLGKLFVFMPENIFNDIIVKKEEVKKVEDKKLIISNFFYQTVVKFTLMDVKDLTLRFLKKKIISFENK